MNSVPSVASQGVGSADFQLGRAVENVLWSLNGSLDMVFKFPRILTPAERAWLHNGGAGQQFRKLGTGSGANLTNPDCWYSFEDQTGVVNLGLDSGPYRNHLKNFNGVQQTTGVVK